MSEDKQTDWIPTAISAIILVLVAFVLIPIGGTTVKSSSIPLRTSGGIDFTLRPLESRCNSDHSYSIEVEVIKHDDWNWDRMEVDGIMVSPKHQGAKVQLVSGLPNGTVPKRFVLEFKTNTIKGDLADVGLRVKLDVTASTNLGVTSGNRSQAEFIPLELPQSPDQTAD